MTQYIRRGGVIGWRDDGICDFLFRDFGISHFFCRYFGICFISFRYFGIRGSLPFFDNPVFCFRYCGIFHIFSHCFGIFHIFLRYFSQIYTKRNFMAHENLIICNGRGVSSQHNKRIRCSKYRWIKCIVLKRESTSCDRNLPFSFSFRDFRFFFPGFRGFPIFLPGFRDLAPLLPPPPFGSPK